MGLGQSRAEPERVLDHSGEQWVPRTEYTRIKAKCVRLRAALGEIADLADDDDAARGPDYWWGVEEAAGIATRALGEAA